MDLGSRILAWLRARDMTQKALAAKVDVSPGAVTAWVKNESDPTHKNLEAIVDALGLTMAEFYGPLPKVKKAKKAA